MNLKLNFLYIQQQDQVSIAEQSLYSVKTCQVSPLNNHISLRIIYLQFNVIKHIYIFQTNVTLFHRDKNII